MVKKKSNPIAYVFVLERLSRLDITVKSFFGCHSIYYGDKILAVLRNKKDHPNDNGVWLATSQEHHASLKKLFPNMRSIGIFGPRPSSWQVLSAGADDFEESVILACELIVKGDHRIGKIPKRQKPMKKGSNQFKKSK